MNKNDVLKALVEDSLYTYEFDVSTGIVQKDIVCRDGTNITRELGMKSPCLFDEMVKRSFGEVFNCRYNTDFCGTELSAKAILNEWKKGKRRLELNLYRGDSNQYFRLTYYLSVNAEDEHVYAYVVCEDITELEKGKGRAADLDNQNLKLERQVLTDDLDYQNVFTKTLMDQLNCGVVAYEIPEFNLLHVNNEALRIFNWKDCREAAEQLPNIERQLILDNPLDQDKLSNLQGSNEIVQYKCRVNSGEKNEKLLLAQSKSLAGRHKGKVVLSTFMDITQMQMLETDKITLTGKNDVLTREKNDLTQERNNLTEERDNLTREKHDLTEERDALTRKNNDLTEERDNLTVENIELNHAVDAVHAILKAGSYVCTYYVGGKGLKSIKYSEALRKLYGYSDENEFPDVWESWINCILPEDRIVVENSYKAALDDKTGKTTYDVTYRSKRKDGVIRWQRTAGYVLRGLDGTPITCYGLVMDVDEQKKATNKIEQALTQAQIASAAKTSFLTRMSHDIRTPMNGILGLIEINDKHADEIAFTSKNRKKARVAANYLLSLINDVLQLSKLEESDVKLSHEAFDAKELTMDIITIVKMRAVENGITVEYDESLSNFQYPYVWGSPLHVRQIFINILGNAIKYNRKNGKIWCTGECRKFENNKIEYKIVIVDNGIGMSDEFQEHLFEPFAREHTETDSGYEGTGLGMPIAKQLVEKMGGSITVESQENKGSRFTVTIPFKLAKREDVKNLDEEIDTYDIAGAKVLLVEDNELNMEIAETLLTDVGVKVTKAYNGEQAVELFNKYPSGQFDVILMDVMMPIMDGYEATKTIRKLDRQDATTIPIIAMTAKAFAEDVQEAKEAGMNEHISKPLDIQKLIALIGKYLS